MDAAHKYSTHFRLSLLLVLALTLSAPTWAFDAPSFQLSSTSITCSSTICPPGFVNVGSSGDTITYNVSPVDYSGDSSNPSSKWLQLNSPVNTNQTTPGQVTFQLGNTSQLTQGLHTAVVHLTGTSPSGNPANVDINFTFNAGSTGGGSGTLFSSINPIPLFAAPNAQAFSNPTITTSSQTSITISVSTTTSSCTGVNWLSASVNGNSSISSSSNGALLNVQGNANGLSAGLCQGTVVVTPSVGTVLNIPVNFNVGSGSGGGNLTASPNPVNFSFVTGGTLPPNATLFLATTTGVSNVNANVSCNQGWLLVNNSTNASTSINSPFTVSVSSNATSLGTGNYTCSIQLSDAQNSGTTYNVSVNLAVNGGSTNGLTVSPNPIVFSAPFNGAQQSTTVAITSQQGGSLSVSQNSGSNFLSFQSPGGTITPGGTVNIAVFANPSGLSVGTYNGSLNITVGSQSISVPVTLNVGTNGTGGGSTAVAPATVNLVYQVTASPSFASHPNISITGPDGQWTTSVTYSGSASGWLLLSPATGILPSNNLLTVGANISGLAQGNYSATLTITTLNGSASVNVNLAVVPGVIIYANPGSANFFFTTGNSNPSPQSVFVNNSDSSAVSFTATPADTWVSVQQNSGSNVFSVSVDPSGKAAGIYTSSVTITEASASNNPYSYPVVLVVNSGGSGGGGTLIFSPSGTLSFSSSNGSIPNSQTLNVSANSSTTFTVTSNQSWLSISPNSGTTSTNLSVSVNPTGLPNGTSTGTLTFNSNGNTQTVNVSITINGSTSGGGNVSVQCSASCGTTQPAMAFTGQFGSGALPIGGINVTSASGSGSVSFTVVATTTTGGNWLSTSVGNSIVTTPFNGLSVNVNVGTGSTALAPGSYTGNLAITPQGGGTVVNVPVSLTVSAPPTVSATPATLTFTWRVGDPNPASQTLTVNPATPALAFGVTVSPANAWLSATPATGTTPGTVTVSINPTGLAAGSYTGTVTVAGTGSAAGSTAVAVSLTVTAPLPTIARVVNAASYLANAVSPGEIITLFASDANHAIGPTTPVGLQLDSSGKVSTTLGGVQVLINGFACPLTYVSATQVNAVVPYEVAPLVAASVLVKYLGQTSNGVTVNIATTSPGTFTLNGSGTGPAAALNSNNTVNAPNNPAARGDLIVLYLTGEGQTSPAGVTGKVTTVSSTPPLTPGPLLPIAITIAGQPANYTFAGEAPTFVSGVLQLNVSVPTNISAGDVSLVVSIGGNTTQTGVTVSVK
jgi:uncharacterized protein (TIGR03437 family)